MTCCLRIIAIEPESHDCGDYVGLEYTTTMQCVLVRIFAAYTQEVETCTCGETDKLGRQEV